MLNLSPRFFRFGAVCALLSVLTTLAVHILPNLWANATSFEQLVDLRLNPIYMAQRWVIIVHCVLVIISMFALGVAKLREATALVSFGFLGFLVFGFTEILRMSLSIFAMNRSWRAGYAAAVDDNAREAFRATIASYSGINDALFFVFYVGFSIGLLCYGLAYLKAEGLRSRIGVLFLLWGALGMPALIDTVSGHAMFGAYFEWVGTYFLPLARLYTGVWLWKNAGALAAAMRTEQRQHSS